MYKLWKNYPTLLWARRLSCRHWIDDVITHAKKSKNAKAFHKSNLKAFHPPDDLHLWCDQFADWKALWYHFKNK